MITTADTMVTAEIQAAEFAAEMTALERRITAPNSRRVIEAVATSGRWYYERESARRWAIYRRADNRFSGFGASLDHARQLTFEMDYPTQGPQAAPRPMRFTVT